ncbi:MAG: hypothetical protein ACLQVI_00010 [Polyangiaceae bacterium]
MSGVILGDWTHRRGDVGGGRAVSAEIERARPKVAWTFRPRDGGNVDQVRIAGERVYVATMPAGDPAGLGWEHATVFALEGSSGRVVAKRELPDPAPVAAMIVDGALVHVLATRHGEPVFWYALDAFDLRPRHRRALALDRAAHWDVLEAWASADGGIWMELDATAGGRRVYAFAKDETVILAPRAKEAVDPDLAPRDACCVGHTLYAPSAGNWDDAGNGTPPSIWQLDPAGDADSPWASSDVTGPHSHAHAVAGGGAVTAIAVAGDPNDRQLPRSKHAIVQAMIVDRESGVVRAQSPVERLATRGACEGARLARRPNGELVFQCTDGEGLPSTDLWRIGPAGETATFPLPRENLVLDAALGDSLLAHAELKGGKVLVSALDIDKERLLGRRAQTIWSIETPDLGGSTTVYAGAGHVLARGAQALAAIRL